MKSYFGEANIETISHTIWGISIADTTSWLAEIEGLGQSVFHSILIARNYDELIIKCNINAVPDLAAALSAAVEMES